MVNVIMMMMMFHGNMNKMTNACSSTITIVFLSCMGLLVVFKVLKITAMQNLRSQKADRRVHNLVIKQLFMIIH